MSKNLEGKSDTSREFDQKEKGSPRTYGIREGLGSYGRGKSQLYNRDRAEAAKFVYRQQNLYEQEYKKMEQMHDATSKTEEATEKKEKQILTITQSMVYDDPSLGTLEGLLAITSERREELISKYGSEGSTSQEHHQE